MGTLYPALSRCVMVLLWIVSLSSLGNTQCLSSYEVCEEPMDCCSGQCVAFQCVPGCTVTTHPCDRHDECCTENCYRHDITQEIGTCVEADFCKNGGASCNESAECCSHNCYETVCQHGTGRCTFPGGQCLYDTDCCEGAWCLDNRCSGSLSLQQGSTWFLVVLLPAVLLGSRTVM